MAQGIIPYSTRLALAATALSMAVAGASAPPAAADDATARELFKAMTTYMAAQNTISFTYDASLEVVTSELQKVGFASTGTLVMSRPDKIRVTRTGGFADIELAYDGKKLTAKGKEMNVFVSNEASGSVDDLFDRLRNTQGAELPAADLLSPNAYDIMMGDVTSASDLGTGVIAGKVCDHLAFRASQIDWQIWIAQGDQPHPCRFEITSKMTAQAPSYRIDVRDWKTGADVAQTTFEIEPGDAKVVTIDQFPAIDEVTIILSEGAAK